MITNLITNKSARNFFWTGIFSETFKNVTPLEKGIETLKLGGLKND